jgi:hypothetical protein
MLEFKMGQHAQQCVACLANIEKINSRKATPLRALRLRKCAVAESIVKQLIRWERTMEEFHRTKDHGVLADFPLSIANG